VETTAQTATEQLAFKDKCLSFKTFNRNNGDRSTFKRISDKIENLRDKMFDSVSSQLKASSYAYRGPIKEAIKFQIYNISMNIPYRVLMIKVSY